MKRLLSTAAIVFTVLAGTVSAHAADYDISTGKDPQYYQSTSYEDHYNAQYNYAGENLIDYQIPEITFGLSQSSQAGPANAMGQIQYGLSVPGSQPSSTTYPDVDFSSVSMPSGGSFEYTYRPEHNARKSNTPPGLAASTFSPFSGSALSTSWRVTLRFPAP